MGLKRRVRVTPAFSLAAMIDIIFLLLMFFMLTSKFVTPNALNLQLPSSSSKTMASPSLAVSVNARGQYYLDGTPIGKDRLFSALSAKIRASNEDPKNTTITVVAEKTVPLDNVVFILDIANRLKVKTILATEEHPEDR
ncbi:MAG: biopolymer transporter ExbD [Lewinellaceae bacterium]|nr:biopolymer transporter ExbD [Saprospiraceae bacterium]MCB9316027.1 biopolymer transporter ExbD [Lewinellaceae bacterium]MCB9330045.1 biopolymer transporter ExbD [Lewinellaceae bacterium]